MIIRNDNITEASLSSGTDLNASAYLSKIISSGGVVNSTIVGAVNSLFSDLKSSGLYTKVKRIYPMVGSTLNSCSLEAKLTGKDILWNSSTGFVFDTNGITCNGIEQRNPAYINDTPYAIFGTNTNIGFTMYNRTSRGPQDGFPLAANDGVTKRFQLNISYQGEGGGSFVLLGASFLQVPDTAYGGYSNGLWAASRTSDDLMKAYRNGVSIGQNTATGSENSNSSGSGLPQINLFDYTTDNFAFLSINDGMNDEESATYYTIVQNFQTSLGREV